MADKRISQLNPHTSPSGSDLLVIVNNNETKKITYADLKDSIVINSDNALLNAFSASYLNDSASFDNRVDSLESWSSSLDSTFATDLQVSIVSSSVAATIGIISQNTGLVTTSSFNQYTASQSTGSLVDRLNSIENATSSYELKGSGILSGSISYNDLTNIPSGIVSESTDLSSINTFTQSIDSRVDSLESWSSSLDDTFATDLQVSIVSSSVAATIGIISQNTGLVSISSFNEYTASQSTASLVSRLDVLESNTGSYATTGSNTFIGNQKITGSVSILIPGGTAYAINENPTPNNEFWAYIVDYPAAQNVAVGWTASIVGGSTYTVTAVSYQHPFNKITLNDGSLQMGYRIGINFSKSSKLWEFNSNGTLTGLPDGLISGSSQLSSSYDSRYVLSGSITQTTWDNIASKPSGIVSGSSQILGGSGIYSSSAQLPTGLISGSSQLPSGLISGSSQLPSGLVSGSSQLPAGLISGSSQLTSSYDGRYTQTGSFNTLSSSVDSRLDILEASIITGSMNYTQVLTNRRTGITTTGTSIISGSITTTGNPIQIMVTGDANPIGGAGWVRLQIFRDGNGIGNIIQVENSSNLNVPYCLNVIDTPSAGTYTYSMRTVDSMSGTFDFGEFNGPLLTAVELKSNTQLPAGLISGSSQLPTGLISGSSQLTSSYDTRYTLSGSVQPLPNGLISGSSQLTSSFATTGSNSFNGNQTITGSLVVSSVAVVTGGVTIPTGSTISLTSGSNLFVDSSGGITGSLTGSVFGIGDVSAFSSSVNTRLNSITSSVTPAGTISGSTQLTSSFDARYLTIDGDNVISGSSQLTSSFEVRGSGIYSSSAQLPSGLISGSSQLPIGLISGSSQLTASYDIRYALSGSGGSATIPAGTISGSSQLTSSFDGRYTLTSSFNAFTASENTKASTLGTYTGSIDAKFTTLGTYTGSLATTGSNSFNGNQTITGSLNVIAGNIIASSITANTSSLYLTSGSNLYVQNNGITEITGSLRVSGSITIQSGSITMPNRPGFRVYGLGGATTAVTVLSGSMTIVDYNQGGWDNTTGTFTAPIAGLYQVNLVCRTNSNSSAQSVQVIVYKNYTGLGTGTAQIMIEWAANTTANHIGGSTISRLAVGDTLRAVVSVGTASFDANDNFSVAYIG